MKHYSIEQWADFLRNLTGEPLRTQMQSHLDTACAQCQRTVTRLHAVSSALVEVEVPDSFLDRARAIFPTVPPRPKPLPRLIAALTFDSLGSPVPQGLRSAGKPSTQRLVYTVEDFNVELLVGPGKSNNTVIVTGQVSTAHRTSDAPSFRIWLAVKSTSLHHTEANSLDEFQLEFSPRPGLRLVILEPETDREIEVPLDPVSGVRRNPRKSFTSPTKPDSSELS